MPGTSTSRIAVLIAATLMIMAGGALAERMPVDQLPQEWASLFPAPNEILDSGYFPIVKPPQDGGELPFVLPGTPYLALLPKAYYDSDGAGTPIKAVSLDYDVGEKTVWKDDGREILLWKGSFDVSVRRYATEGELVQSFTQAYEPARDEAVSIGDQAFFDATVGRDEEHLYVRVGRHWVTVDFSIAPGMYRQTVHEPLKQVAMEWARRIVARIEGSAGGGAQTGGAAGNTTGQQTTTPPGPRALELLVQGPNLLPIMGSGDVQITVRDAQTHVPVRDTTVRITLLDQAKLPFVALQQPAAGPVPASTPFVRRITVNQPDQAMVDDGRLKLYDMPLKVRLKIEAWLNANPAVRTERQWSAKMDLLLLRGTTVGPDMQPRSEVKPPRLLGGSTGRSHLASQLHPTNLGEFFVLVRASLYSDQCTLAWPPGCRLGLQVPMTRFSARMAGQRAEAGETVNLGKIDLLEPAEHEQRLKTWVAEFLDAMGFDNGHLAATKAAIIALPVQYLDGSADMPPRYGAGRIEVFQAPQNFWGKQAFAPGDPPYAIFLHELGHAVHKGMVDRWLDTLSIWDACFVGGGHSTWTTPDAVTEKGRAMTAFFEALADFHAYCVYRWLDVAHPEFRQDSLYYDRGYLAEFDGDSRALAARSLGGWQVEGVVSTFLRELYRNEFTADRASGATVFGQVLRMADTWKRESWVLRWVPARTITEWVAMKRKHAPVPELDALVQKYGLTTGATGRVLLPTGSTATPVRATIGGTAYTLLGDNAVLDVSDGQTVTMLEGQGLVLIEVMGQPGMYRRVFLDERTTVRFDAGDRLTVEAGRVIVDGQITITHGTLTVRPTGTTVMVEVDATGTTTVTVVEGSAQVTTPVGSVTLSAAQQVAVGADGRAGAPQTVAVAAAVDAVLGSAGTGGGQVVAGAGQTTGGGPIGTTTGQAQGMKPMPLAGDSAIKQAVICLGFDERSRLRGVQEVFPANTEKVALFLAIEDARPNSEIQITWYHEDKIIGRNLLIVSGDKKNISYIYAAGRQWLWPGAYAVELRENGRLVGRLIFRVQQ